MYTGRCLCGSVHYEVTGEISNIVFCHCSQCRKAQGSAYATNGNVHKQNFRFCQGEDLLTAYATAPGRTKYFCSRCGSPVISIIDSNPDYVRIRLGLLENDIKEKPTCHIFVGSKANWDNIVDDLPQFDEWPT